MSAAVAVAPTIVDTNGWNDENKAGMRLWVQQISIMRLNYVRAASLWWWVYVVLSILTLCSTGLSGVTQVPTIGCPISSSAACIALQWFGVVCAALGVVFGGI